ncbi:MAG: endonuclease/exonuclease/phosphatase family protein [Flavobacteriales bacterium]|nr:endonuclease/exonuclease/phosphatase family protein [Flavobacteriales bacterium]
MMKKLLSWWADGPVAAGVLLSVAVVLAFAPDHFLPMLARAFLVQWAVAFGLIAVWNLPQRRWWTGGASMLALALTLWPTMDPVEQEVPLEGPDVLRVAQMNLLQPNDDHAEVLEEALATGADVISFQEVSPEWAQVLKVNLKSAYPFHRSMPGTNCYGIALFSKIPFEQVEVKQLCRRPMVEAMVRTPNGLIRLFCVHATSPGNYTCFRERNEQLDMLATLINSSSIPTILIGDLNTVGWDKALARLCNRTGLREHSKSTGATWPSIAGMALIPLDHVLVTRQLSVSSLDSFRISGSDHRGLVSTIQARI